MGSSGWKPDSYISEVLQSTISYIASLVPTHRSHLYVLNIWQISWTHLGLRATNAIVARASRKRGKVHTFFQLQLWPHEISSAVQRFLQAAPVDRPSRPPMKSPASLSPSIVAARSMTKLVPAQHPRFHIKTIYGLLSATIRWSRMLAPS